MRIQRSTSLKEYLVQGCLRSDLMARVRDPKWLGQTLVAMSVALGLALLVGMAAYLRTLRPVLPRLRGWLDQAQARKSGLPTLYLDLDRDAYQALSMQRQKAVRTGILFPADAVWAPAQVRFEGQAVPVRVRLAGSEPDGSAPVSAAPMDHWAPNKWSLEVEVEGSGKIRGARVFSLLSPAMQGYLNGWLYAEGLRRAGLPAPGYDYTNLVLNGENWGIYVMEVGPPVVPSALDAESLGRFQAHADLWGARRPGSAHRPAHLAHPDTPIVGPASPVDPDLVGAYLDEAKHLSQPEYLRVLQRIYGRAFRRYHDALATEFFAAYLQAPWDALAERQRALLTTLPSQEAMRDAPPVPDVVPGVASPQPAIDLPPAPSVEEALARHPFLRPAERGDWLQVAPGTWQVQGDLVLPAGVGLRASEAFTLTLEREAMLLVRGPLDLRGPAGEGIRLLPQKDHWGGIVVLGTGQGAQSSLHNVEIRGVRGIGRGDGQAGGGITFVDMPVQFYRCRVLDSYAPAAVHIMGAPFEWLHSEFGVALGDLLWAQGAQGSIERCAFHDTLGSALRLVKSDVNVLGASLLRVQGTALLASQDSVVRAHGLRARDVGIAVAAADGASALIRDARVGQAHIAGFAAYRQQAAYGPAIVEASEVVFEDGSRNALVQEGNSATIDGLPVEAQALDSADLHRPPKGSPPMRPLQVRFGPAISLAGYELTTPELAPGETVEVILYWRTFALLDRQYTVFVHLLDASGEWVAGWDMMPRYNTFPTTDWPVAELIDDVHIVPLRPDLPPGEYTVALGMYYWGTGERLPAYTRQGETLPEGAVVLKETVTVK